MDSSLASTAEETLSSMWWRPAAEPGGIEQQRERVKLKRDHSQNLQHMLWDREQGYNRRNLRHQPPAWNMEYEREFHKCITPNMTIQNVDKPHGYLRKFTPDGRLMLSFSQDQRSLEVYEYCSLRGFLVQLLERQQGECITAAAQDEESMWLRSHVFKQVFKLRWNINLTPPPPVNRTHLNREFSIFLDDGRYVILVSVSIANAQPPCSHLFDYPDLYDECDLFVYTLFLIDLRRGGITDLTIFRHDSIMLSHNQGVSAHGRTVALLSKYRQCIELWQVTESGNLVKLYNIGPFGAPRDDEALFQIVPTAANRRHGMPLDALPLSFIKQRIMAYLYREIWESTGVEVVDLEVKKTASRVRRAKLREFYKNFKIYERMIMVKMQLIDNDHLLIRYEERPSQMPPIDPSIGPFTRADRDDKHEFQLYVFYKISSEEILKIYARDSVELLLLLRDCCDSFRDIRSLQNHRPTSSPSNDVYFRAAFNRNINSILGGQSAAAIRFNPTLPISTQSFATTQYLDYSLFYYSDSAVSSLERPKITSQEPICFKDRTTGITKFRLFLENSGGSSSSPESPNDGIGPNSPRELVSFIFHPYEPFFISNQKIGTRYVMNFHLYNKTTVVRP